MKIALVSLDQVWEDKDANLKLCEDNIKEASQYSVDLIVFPEMTLTGFSTNVDYTSENFENSSTLTKFSDLAQEYNISILFGIVIKEEESIFNKAVYINSQGEILGAYSKIHPFSFSGENEYFDAGNSLVIVSDFGMRIALSICYDLRFPELYSAYAVNADLIINIANWPSKRVEHWNVLLKARSIENQVFVAGVNRVGTDGNGLEYNESSYLYDANGQLVTSELSESMKIYSVDAKDTQKFKDGFNTVNDRKIALYRAIL